MSVSGTYRPPNAPNRPRRSTRSAPVGSRRAARTKAARRRGSGRRLRSRPDAASTSAGRASRTALPPMPGPSPPAMPAGRIRLSRRAISTGLRAASAAPRRACPLEEEVRRAGCVPGLGAAQRGTHGRRPVDDAEHHRMPVRALGEPWRGPRRTRRAGCRAAGRGCRRSSPPHDRSRPRPARGRRERAGRAQTGGQTRRASGPRRGAGCPPRVTNPAKSASAATAARTPASLRVPAHLDRGPRRMRRDSTERSGAGVDPAPQGLCRIGRRSSAVPMRTACAPASAARRAAPGSERPLSATTVAPAARAAAMQVEGRVEIDLQACRGRGRSPR